MERPLLLVAPLARASCPPSEPATGDGAPTASGGVGRRWRPGRGRLPTAMRSGTPCGAVGRAAGQSDPRPGPASARARGARRQMSGRSSSCAGTPRPRRAGRRREREGERVGMGMRGGRA